MNTTDIVILVFIFLMALIGCFKGFLSALLSLIGTLLSYVGATYLAKPITTLLNNWFHIVENLGKDLATKFVPCFTEFAEPLTGAEIKQNYVTENNFLQKMLNLFIEDETTYASSTELTQTLGKIGASLIVIVIATIIAFLLIKLALFLISKLFNAIKRHSRAVNGADKVLGFFIGICKALLIICIVFVIGNLLQTLPSVADALTTIFDGSVVAKPLYDYITNLAIPYIKSIDFNSLFSAVISA